MLRALAEGDAERARAAGRELAERELAGTVVRLALQVLDGGPFVDDRIVELCQALLQRAVEKRRSA